MRWILMIAGLAGLIGELRGQDLEHAGIESEFGEYVEEGFPFFGQVVDGRELGAGMVPRGIVMKLGNGVYGCFDPDLLRLAMVWRETEEGEWLEMNSMSAGSYRVPSMKASAGQGKLPRAKGEMICATGVYPGVFNGKGKATKIDPRGGELATESEDGLGPMDESIGKFLGIQMTVDGSAAGIRYRIGKREMSERYAADPEGRVFRMIGAGPSEDEVQIVLGEDVNEADIDTRGGARIQRLANGLTVASIPPTPDWEIFISTIGGPVDLRTETKVGPAVERDARFWKQVVGVPNKVSDGDGGFVIDEIGLPISNPWKRNVRLSGMGFFSDGRLAVCTFDGDVWLVEGVSMGSEESVWRRYASGLHEPMGLQVVEDEVFVFDRAGIWRLNDENGDGEADFYEMWSNVVPQTAETREFAMDLLAKPGGGFYVVKGGQEESTKGIANGTICEVSADGRSYKVIGRGLRQPYAGIDPETGMVTSSDQQGHWVPATPIHVIEEGKHYGYVPSVLEQVRHEGLQEPAVWIPHIVNQSGASQVFLRDAKMGALNDALIHIGYNRPELFRVYLDESGAVRQGAVASAVTGFPCALLHGAVSPVDGQLYVCGFRIWGTALDQISGLFRVRSAGGESTVPEEIRSEERGILLRFGFELDEAVATSPLSYTVERWNYERSKNYGSGHYRPDGEPGQEAMPVASVTLSEDGKAVFLGIPDMAPVNTLSVRYRVAQASDLPRVQSAYLTVHELNGFDLQKAGFERDEVELEIDPSMLAAVEAAPEPSVEHGAQLAATIGCVACHSVDGSQLNAQPGQVVGPTWKGLWGTKRELSDGTVVKSVDAPYLRESIFEPGAKMAKGFENMGVGMPSYLGILQDWQVESVILYIESLGGKKGKKLKS